jgi:hypothetical protein
MDHWYRLKSSDVKYKQSYDEDGRKYQPEVFLHPMSKWHLYSEFKEGKNVGGRIEFVWMFGIIGVFVLLLACINFMNLSTARSEKRAKEVGIQKIGIGSMRAQLINQFFTESDGGGAHWHLLCRSDLLISRCPCSMMWPIKKSHCCGAAQHSG